MLTTIHEIALFMVLGGWIILLMHGTWGIRWAKWVGSLAIGLGVILLVGVGM